MMENRRKKRIVINSIKYCKSIVSISSMILLLYKFNNSNVFGQNEDVTTSKQRREYHALFCLFGGS